MNKQSSALADSLIKIRPCVAKDGKEINKREFEEWKGYFRMKIDSLTDKSPLKHYELFKHSAGEQLMNLLDALDVEDTVKVDKAPIDKAFEILKKHFDGSVNTITARVIFRNSSQDKKESCEAYVTRVIREAKKCEFKTEVVKEILSVIRVNSLEKELRQLSGDPACTMESIRDKAKSIDLDNELQRGKDKKPLAELNSVVKGKSKKSKRHRVSSSSGDESSNSSSSDSEPEKKGKKKNKKSKRDYDNRFSSDKRMEPTHQQKYGYSQYSRQPEPVSYSRDRYSSGAQPPSRSSCYRCGDLNHLANHCAFFDKICSFCKRRGHKESVCFAKVRQGGANKYRSPERSSKHRRSSHQGSVAKKPRGPRERPPKTEEINHVEKQVDKDSSEEKYSA